MNQPPSSCRCDVVVVGLGAMGMATTEALARRGASVIGLDQFNVPHDRGSSHGESRVIRLCYYEHADYVPLIHRAYDLWRSLESRSNQRLLTMTGGLYMGPPDGEFVSQSFASAVQHDLPHEQLTRAAIRDRYPQFEVPDGFEGLWEPNAGILAPERCIEALAREALANGAKLRACERVVDWTSDAGEIEVFTTRNTIRASSIVLCPGAWASKLLKLPPERIPELSVTRQILGWFWPSDPKPFAADRFPIWGMDDPDGYFYYGFPLLPRGRPGLKCARHYEGERVDPDQVNRNVTAAEIDELRHMIERFIPRGSGPVMGSQVCMYTNTPDRHFIIDRHPEYELAFLACGFSGHGFKFASIIGEIMADLALDGRTSEPIDFLRLDRFARG